MTIPTPYREAMVEVGVMHAIDVAESHEAVRHFVGSRSADGLVSVGRKFVPEMVATV
jgi:hypothetical protein